MAIKIVGVACSPRAGQSTHWALSACLDVIRQEFKNVEPVMIDLAGMDVHGCMLTRQKFAAQPPGRQRG